MNRLAKLAIRVRPFFAAVVCVLAVFGSGCATNRPVVVAEWRGSLIDEHRINEKIQLGCPIVKKMDWDIEPGNLLLDIQQEKTNSFDLKRKYEHMKAVRSQTYAQTRATVPAGEQIVDLVLAPVAIPIAIGKSRKEASEFQKMEKDAIDRLKSGNSRAQVNQEQTTINTTKMGTSTFFYERQVSGEELETIHSKPDCILIPVVGYSVSAEDISGSRILQTATTDNNGVVRFNFVDSVAKALVLKPMSIRFVADVGGKKSEIATVDLDEMRVAQVVERIRRSTLAATGIPQLPPFAKVLMALPAGEVTAGSEMNVGLVITNVGKGEFYQLVATTESPVAELNEIRLEFGKVVPGENSALVQKVRLPANLPTSSIPITFRWSELNGYAPDQIAASIKVRGLARPQFAMRVQVLDDNSGNSVGNGDGRIQKGEAVDLLVTVKNIGEGKAIETHVTLSDVSAEGVSVNVPEATVGDLVPGESKSCRLTISTKKSVEIDKLTPLVRIQESQLNVSHEERLTLALDSELPPSIMGFSMKVYVGNEEAVIRSGAGSETTVIGRAKPGTALQATGELGQWLRVELPQIGTGWLPRSAVSFEPTEASAAASAGGVIEILQKAPPLIAVAKPLDNSTVNSPRVEVSGIIADDRALARTEFKLNGKSVEVGGSRGIGVVGNGAAGPRELPFSFTVDLAKGRNQFDITAWDEDGLKTTKMVTIDYERAQGNVFIVSIGIDNYKSVPRLKYSVSDAKAVAETLKRRLEVPDKNVFVLLDDQATLSNIKDTLGVKLRKSAGKEDTVIIYFAGHGAPEADPHSPDADGVSKYLLPVEADASSLFSSALPMEEVRTIFRRLVSERVIFLADTCYSGSAGGRTLMPSGTQFRSINQNNLLARLRDTGTGRVILTASQGSEVSQEKDELHHGVFTYYLLQGLDGKADKNQDGTVSITELYQYLSSEVPQATDNTQHPLMAMDELVGEMVVSVVK